MHREKNICHFRLEKNLASLNFNGGKLTASMNIRKTEMLFQKQNIIARNGTFDLNFIALVKGKI